MIATPLFPSRGDRAALRLQHAWVLLLLRHIVACLAIASLAATTPAVARAQCADYAGSFRLLGSADLAGRAKDVAIDGGLAYVASGDACAGCAGRLDIFDVATAGEPGGGAAYTGGLALPGGPATVAVAGGRAYVGTSGGALHVVDVADPAAPVLVRTLQGDRFHDLAAGSGLLCAATDWGLAIFDLADPDAPARVGGRAFTGGARAVAFSANVAFVVWGDPGTVGSALSSIDLSTPAQPRVLHSLSSTATLITVAVAGERAYVGGGFRYRDLDGFVDVIDVSDPARPVLAASLNDLKRPVNGIAVAGEALFATAADPWFGWASLYVVDTSDARAPLLVRAEDLEFPALSPSVASGVVYFCEDRSRGGLRFARAPANVRAKALASLPWSIDIQAAALQADRAYLVDGSPALAVMDLSDPGDPRLLGSMSTPRRGEAVAVQGTYAYVGYATRPLDVVDVANPQAPAIVASVPQASGVVDLLARGTWLYTTGWNGTRTIDITNPRAPVARGYVAADGIAMAVDGTHAYVLKGYSLSIVDIADPAAPVLAGTLGMEAARDLAVADGHAFVVDWRGVRVIDVSDPAHPVEVARIDDAETADAVGIRIEGDVAYLAHDGLAVVDIGDPLEPVFLGETETGIDVWPRGIASAGSLVVTAGTSLSVFPVQCPPRDGRKSRDAARALALSAGPNPLRGEAPLRLDLLLDPAFAEGGAEIPVRVVVVDVAGRPVAHLADGPLAAGPHVLHWDGRRDRDGRSAPAGVYWLRVDAAGLATRTARVVKIP